MIVLINVEEFILIEIDEQKMPVGTLFLYLKEQLNSDEFAPNNPLIKIAEINGFTILVLEPGWEFTLESYPHLINGMITLADGTSYTSEITLGTGTLEQQ